MLVLLHNRVDHSQHSPRPRLIDGRGRRLDTPKTLLAFAALGSTAAAGYASKRESITQDEGCMPKPQSGQKAPQVSTAHRRSGGRSWAPEKKARSKKTCMKRRHRITMERGEAKAARVHEKQAIQFLLFLSRSRDRPEDYLPAKCFLGGQINCDNTTRWYIHS